MAEWEEDDVPSAVVAGEEEAEPVAVSESAFEALSASAALNAVELLLASLLDELPENVQHYIALDLSNLSCILHSLIVLDSQLA